MAQFKKARNFTSGVAFFLGDGMLDEDVVEEVQDRFNLRKEKEHKIVRKKKKRLIELRLRVNAVKAFIRK